MPGNILGALLDIGFNDFYEVAVGALAVSQSRREFLIPPGPRPMIS